MANRYFNKQVAQPRMALKAGGRAMKMGGGKMISGKARKDEESGFYSPDMGMRGGTMMKKGGSVKKKKMKQGYKDRKDESIAMRIKKKRTKKQFDLVHCCRIIRYDCPGQHQHGQRQNY